MDLGRTNEEIRKPENTPAPAAVVELFAPRPASARSGRSAKVALIGGFAPRKCGIATFTTDLYQQVTHYHPEMAIDVFAMNSATDPLEYRVVAGVIAQDDAEDYRRTARTINEAGYDVVWLQHEYGIFGGTDGEMVLDLVDRLAAPLIVTLHTVLQRPSERQRAILNHLISRAARIMVMSRHSRDLLVQLYNADPARLAVIPHGAPDRPLGRQEQFKTRFGLQGRKVLMTFGLLGPGKGLERAIEAMPAIVARHPDVLYRIVGATHPNLVAHEGEAYRERLMALADELGVAEHIAWDNRFLDTEELLDQLEACDIYLTPYPNLQQSTSGTLSYAVALGKAVVSTPYVHARELLDGAAGCLIAPQSSLAIAEGVNGLFDSPEALAAMQRRAYAVGRRTIWPRFAESSADLAMAAIAPAAPSDVPLLAIPGLSAVRLMTDSTGIYQHAIGPIPDRRHGYCLDDNVRALMLANLAEGITPEEREQFTTTYASFIQYAWNPDLRRFRNFMRFDRTWCEDVGSEDSNGRTLWTLGETVLRAQSPAMAWWARKLFDDVQPSLREIGSPRAVAFAMLGARALVESGDRSEGVMDELRHGGELLAHLLDRQRRPDWAWFEAVLGYDNPRLSQALIEAGRILERPEWVVSGLETLRWIADQQTSSGGLFRAIGCESYGLTHEHKPFDQQPLEAWASIEAAMTAWRVDPDKRWLRHSLAAYRWFFGRNDRGVVLADIASGRCRDGITPLGANENCGAESILAFQLSHYAMLALARSAPEEVGGAGFGHQERAVGWRSNNP